MDKGEQELVAKVELDYVKTNEKGKNIEFYAWIRASLNSTP